MQAQSQTSSEPHYRWTEKVDESFANVTPVRASWTTILTRWGLLPFTGQAQYRCADRTGREPRTYTYLISARITQTITHPMPRDPPSTSCRYAKMPRDLDT